jgi:hypothetical protein
MGIFKRSKSKPKKISGERYFFIMMNGTALHLSDKQADSARGIGQTPLGQKIWK